MRKILPTDLDAFTSHDLKLKYSIRPTEDGLVLIRYKSVFRKLIGVKLDEYLIINEAKFPQDDTKLDFKSYTEYCERGFNDNPMDDEMLDLLNAATGVAEEANEMMGVIRKFVFHNKPFSLEDFASEAGDMTWYLANLLRLIGIQLSDVLKANKTKLDLRYPNGRDKNYQRNKRDKDGEKIKIKELLSQSGAYDTYRTYNKLRGNGN